MQNKWSYAHAEPMCTGEPQIHEKSSTGNCPYLDKYAHTNSNQSLLYFMGMRLV